MIPNKRKLPVLKRKKQNEEDVDKQKEDEYKSNENFIKQNSHIDNKIIFESPNDLENENNINNDLERNTNNQINNIHRPSEGFEIPEFLLRPENDHYFQSYMRMRQRNITDGAIIINLENDDISNNRIDLYDNKGINVTIPVLNENLANNVEYFLENTNRDKFFKIPKQTVLKMQKIEKIEENKKKFKDLAKKEDLTSKIDKNIDIHRITEDEMFENFDKKLTEVINKTANKISLLFLFIQGLLAGKQFFFIFQEFHL